MSADACKGKAPRPPMEEAENNLRAV
jgi:hypothetical protein